MKYLLILLWVTYFIWWVAFFAFLEHKENTTFNIEKIKESIVIIVPKNELISYKNNPEWLFEEYKNSWIWAGFFISKNWNIQTVNHIVENDKIKYTIIYKNKEYDSIVSFRNKEKDLAIINIVSKDNIEITPLIKELNFSETEDIFSFWVDIQNLEIIYNTWTTINKKSKLDNLSNLLEISNTLKPGFSWWPIVNSKWKVIWINYAISEWKNYWISF